MKTFEQVRDYVTALLQEREETRDWKIRTVKREYAWIIDGYTVVPSNNTISGKDVRYRFRVAYQSGEGECTGYFHATAYQTDAIDIATAIADAINRFIHS